MIRSRRKRSQRIKRHYSLRGGGGFISDIWAMGNKYHSSWWGTYISGLPAMSRSAMSLLHETNIAFEFYTYCNNIDVLRLVGSDDDEGSGIKKIILVPGTIDRFNGRMLKLKQFLTTIINSAVLPKMFGYGYAKATGDEKEYNKIIKDFSKIHEQINDEKPSNLSVMANEGMIAMWGDWYRYELNIHVTNLLTIVEEIIGMSVLPMKPSRDAVADMTLPSRSSQASLLDSSIGNARSSAPPSAANRMFAPSPILRAEQYDDNQAEAQAEATVFDWWVSKFDESIRKKE